MLSNRNDLTFKKNTNLLTKKQDI